MAGRFWRAWRARQCLCRWRCRASRRACASWKRSAGMRRPRWKRLLLPRRNGLRRRAGILARAAAASISTRITRRSLNYKQAILRETLERGGVHAPEEIAVLAGEPWAYRNRIRRGIRCGGKSRVIAGGGRMRWFRLRSARLPRRCWCRLRSAPRNCSGGSLFRAGPLRSRSFAMQQKQRCWPVSSRMARHRFRSRDYFDALLPQIPALRGVELVEVRQGQPRTVARAGAESIAYRAAGFDYRVDHGAFFQVNRWLVDELVECVTQGLSGERQSWLGSFRRRGIVCAASSRRTLRAWLQWSRRLRRWRRSTRI